MLVLSGWTSLVSGIETAEQIMTTAFPGERHMIYFLAFCTPSAPPPANPRIDVQGNQGAATAGTEMLFSEECGGVRATNTAYYTWTTGSSALEDVVVFASDWGPPIPGTYSVALVIKRAAIKVTSIDLETGTLKVDINGSIVDSFGKISLEFIGENGDDVKMSSEKIYQAGQGIEIKIDRTKIPKGTYKSLRANWLVTTYRGTGEVLTHTVTDTYTPPKPWKVLGIVQYTQYNTPHESACADSSSMYYVVDSQSSCKFMSVNLPTLFAKQVEVNGTGNSSAHGLLKIATATNLEKVCAGKFPSGAHSRNTFLKVPLVDGACLIPLTADSSVATYESTGRANCGARFTLVSNAANETVGYRQRHDHCPACVNIKNGTDGHIDNYSAKANCDAHSVGDLGNFWTLQN